MHHHVSFPLKERHGPSCKRQAGDRGPSSIDAPVAAKLFLCCAHDELKRNVKTTNRTID